MDTNPKNIIPSFAPSTESTHNPEPTPDFGKNSAHRSEPTPDFGKIQANLHIVREQAKELADELEQLEGRLKMARGSVDLTAQARIAVAKIVVPRVVPKISPRAQVESALRHSSLNVAQVAKATGLSIGKAADHVRALRQERRVANTGSEDFPKWTMKLGDDGSTQELIAEVKRLITERPMTTQELHEFTAARVSRISGALVHLQRTERQLLNLGTARRAKWFLVGDGVTLARLPQKGAQA